MKKLLILTVVIICSAAATKSQVMHTAPAGRNAHVFNTESEKIKAIPAYLKLQPFTASEEKADYLQKSRNQKIAGWCFVGAGAVGLAIGLASFPKGDLLFPSDEDASKADRATTITIIGSALLIGSTPFFILSNVNKRKARLSVSSNKTGFGVPSKVSKNITGITWTMPIGK